MSQTEPVPDHLGSVWPYREDKHYRALDSGCWEWMCARDNKGYGIGPATNGERRMHRAAWAARNGPIPPRSHIHHVCENKWCVNPDHLECKSHSAHLRDHKRVTIAKLTLQQVNEIRGRLAQGELQIPLAREYGVTGRVIWQICNDVKWRDDPDAPPNPIKWERYCPECGAQIEGRHDKKFCSPHHRKLFNGRRGWRRRNGLDPDSGAQRTAPAALDEERRS